MWANDAGAAAALFLEDSSDDDDDDDHEEFQLWDDDDDDDVVHDDEGDGDVRPDLVGNGRVRLGPLVVGGGGGGGQRLFPGRRRHRRHLPAVPVGQHLGGAARVVAVAAGAGRGGGGHHHHHHHHLYHHGGEAVTLPGPLAIDWLDLSAFPESVALSELPGSRFRGRFRDFGRDLSTILGKDITDVVCLLTEPEFRKFRVPDLLHDYRSAGLVVYHFPIEDGAVPADPAQLDGLLAKIRKRIADGNRVLVHCFGGLGRAVLVGACLTLALEADLSPAEVISQMRTLRGPRAVQSVKQFNFINEYRDLSCCCSSNSCAGPNFDDDNESCISR